MSAEIHDINDHLSSRQRREITRRAIGNSVMAVIGFGDRDLNLPGTKTSEPLSTANEEGLHGPDKSIPVGKIATSSMSGIVADFKALGDVLRRK